MLVAGAGGFARELLAVLLQRDEYPEIVFYDDVTVDAPEMFMGRYRILKTPAAAREFFKNHDPAFALGVGSPASRRGLFELMLSLGGSPVQVLSPHAKIGALDNRIDDGVEILTDVVIESNNRVGKGTLLHVGSFVSHDVSIGSFCEISPRANLLGGVHVGDLCSIGTAATILPRVVIGENCVIGAGAVVTRDIEDNCIAMGVPARARPRIGGAQE